METLVTAPMLDHVEKWAAVNSGTSNLPGLATMVDLLGGAFARLPGDVRCHVPDSATHCTATGHLEDIAHGDHLHLSVRPDAPIRLLLTGHMDTVFAVDHPFQTVSWREDDVLQGVTQGILHGPGTADMKGGLAVMLAALVAFEISPFAARIGYDVLINSDEETGSHSSAQLIAELAHGKLAALTYEPALPDGTLAGARPGSGSFAICFRGRAAHAGRNPEEGRNALLAAADCAVRLAALTRAGLKVNVAKIEGGGPLNVVPDFALVRVNMRPQTLQLQGEAEAALTKICTAIAQEHDVQSDLHGGFNRPPKPLDTAAARLFALVVECGAALSIPVAERVTGGVCDGNNIAACGVAVVDTMGVRGGAIHSSEEFMIIDSLVERARLSALTLMRLAERGRL